MVIIFTWSPSFHAPMSCHPSLLVEIPEAQPTNRPTVVLGMMPAAAEPGWLLLRPQAMARFEWGDETVAHEGKRQRLAFARGGR